MKNINKTRDRALKLAYYIEYDEDDKVYLGRCAELPSVIAHGKKPDLALKEIQTAVAEVLKWMQQEGQDLPDPISLSQFSGKFRLRMSPEKHRKIAIEARLRGVSMNQLIVNKI